MRIVALPRPFYTLARYRPIRLSPQAEQRHRSLRCWQALRARGCSTPQASRIVGLSRATLFRWQKRLQQEGPRGLEPKSRRPQRRRQPTWSPELAQGVLRLREAYPRWGKDKLAVLLRRQGWEVSTSMVGRILRRLKVRGVLKEPPRNRVAARRRQAPRPYAVRKPQAYLPRQPGDLVQLDTLELRPVPGVVLKQFTAQDVISRWNVLEVHGRATARTAAGFLDTLQRRLPFPVRALQVDGGSEFRAAFEEACQKRGIKLFVLPPRSPQLNGHVERAQRVHAEEFYEGVEFPVEMALLHQALQLWERTYNTVRPHQALDGRTPLEYLSECHPRLAPPVSHVLNEYNWLNLGGTVHIILRGRPRCKKKRKRNNWRW